MNKETKKAVAMINEKESQNREMLSKIEVEITNTEAKLTALRADLEKAENGEQYKDILKEIRDYEDVLKFCEKKKSTAAANTLSETEYRAILAEIKKARDAAKADMKKTFIADVEKLTATLGQWDSINNELNGVAQRAANLTAGNNPVLMNAQTIADGDEILLGYITTFYRLKAYMTASGRG